MKNYNKPEIEIILLAEVDVIRTSAQEEEEVPQTLTTWGTRVNPGQSESFFD